MIDENKRKESYLRRNLVQFTGTENYYYTPLFPKFRYTDGIRFLAKEGGAYWLLDYIFSHSKDLELERESFQVWKIQVQEDQTAIFTVSDGREQILKTLKISYTDFPLQTFSIWLIDGVLMLPGEY